MSFFDKVVLLTWRILEDTEYYTYYYMIVLLKIVDYLTTKYILSGMNNVKLLLGISVDLVFEQNYLVRNIIVSGGYGVLLDTMFVVMFYIGFAMMMLAMLISVTMVRYGEYSKYSFTVSVLSRIYFAMALLMLYPVARNILTMMDIIVFIRGLK